MQAFSAESVSLPPCAHTRRAKYTFLVYFVFKRIATPSGWPHFLITRGLRAERPVLGTQIFFFILTEHRAMCKPPGREFAHFMGNTAARRALFRQKNAARPFLAA
jgi:hypothetical protein